MKARDIDGLFAGALGELGNVLRSGTSAEVERLSDEVQSAHRIACYGVGREGLMMRAFCMRLMHLGFDAHMVGDMTAPVLGAGDLLLVSAGPGSFSTVKALAGVAQASGARVTAVTAQPKGEVPRAAEVVVHIRAQTMANDAGGNSVLPMGSLYEASMLIFFDIVSIVLRDRTGQTAEGMRGRHTNLE